MQGIRWKTYIFLKIFKRKLIWLWEEFQFVHTSNIEDDICALFHRVSINDIVL